MFEKDMTINVMSKDGSIVIGQIIRKKNTKGRSGRASYEVTFPVELNLLVKATLVGSIFLLDAAIVQRIKGVDVKTKVEKNIAGVSKSITHKGKESIKSIEKCKMKVNVKNDRNQVDKKVDAEKVSKS